MRNLNFKLFILSFVIMFTGRINTSNSAPTVTSTSPVMNSNNVSKSTDIQVVFSEAMDASTINSSNIKVFGLQTGLKSAGISYNGITFTATINPSADFKTGEKVHVILSAGVKSSSNVSITPYTWMFIVKASGGTGQFVESFIIDTIGPASGNQIQTGDIDNDGDADILTCSYAPDVYIYKNDGSGNFIKSQRFNTFPGIDHVNGLVLGDYDNDGDLDFSLSLSTTTFLLDSLVIYKNDGSGNFARYSTVRGGGIGGETGDLDGDGDLDIVLSWAFATVNYFLNDGSGNITRYSLSTGFSHAAGMSIGDIDKDGDLDITVFVSNSPDTRLVTFKNDGNAGFTLFQALPEVTHLSSNRSADFNGDGDIDIPSYKVIFNNDGTGTYSTSFLAGYDNDYFPGDYDADGDLDIVYSSGSGNDVKTFINNGAGSFAETYSSDAGSFTVNLASSDFDNDGDIDIAVNNTRGSSIGSLNDISILMNQSSHQCAISGPTNVPINSVTTYMSNLPGGFWTLSNYGATAAAYLGSNTNDSLVISSGSVGGHFVLYYRDGTGVLCHLHVYVDDPLPVELESFTANVHNHTVNLNWTTSSEINNSGFDIERLASLSGFTNENWSKVGYVEGNGTVSNPVSYTFTDRNLNSGKYKYRLKQIDFNGNFEYHELQNEIEIGVPSEYNLSQNYPNPFNPVTVISYQLKTGSIVSLKVYDIIGKEVAILVNSNQEAGYYSVSFDGNKLTSGIYFYKLETDNFTAIKKMTLLK